MALPNKLAEEQSTATAAIVGSAMGVSRSSEDIAVTVGDVVNESRNTGRVSAACRRSHELVEQAGVLKQSVATFTAKVAQKWHTLARN